MVVQEKSSSCSDMSGELTSRKDASEAINATRLTSGLEDRRSHKMKSSKISYVMSVKCFKTCRNPHEISGATKHNLKAKNNMHTA